MDYEAAEGAQLGEWLHELEARKAVHGVLQPQLKLSNHKTQKC